MNLETVSPVTIAFGVEQTLEWELLCGQIIDAKDLYSLFECPQNEVVGGHHSLYLGITIITDLKQLLISLLIPHYHLIIIEP